MGQMAQCLRVAFSAGLKKKTKSFTVLGGLAIHFYSYIKIPTSFHSILGGFLVGLAYCVPGLLFAKASLMATFLTVLAATFSGFFGSLLGK